jgi:NAD(P)-dependent dehydrogenase (short-subunit alcohol dehydrogenase family)
MQEIVGKTAFITGGASGIGLGICKAFANAGMKVVMADLRQDHLDQAIGYFTERNQRNQVHSIRLDVTDRRAMAAAAAETERLFGKIHVLVNNAGVGVTGPVKNAKFDDWDWGMEVNLGGVINGIVIFLPYLLKHGEGGYIINTSSMAAIVPMKRAAIYITAKSAILGLSEVLRGELEADHIGVSAFCPGPVQTNISESPKLRPERYRRDSGYAEAESQLLQRPNDSTWMDPVECGERVLRGMLNNDLYIFTHPEFKKGTAERCAAILAAFPDEPINEARYRAIQWLTENSIYPESVRNSEARKTKAK